MKIVVFQILRRVSTCLWLNNANLKWTSISFRESKGVFT